MHIQYTLKYYCHSSVVQNTVKFVLLTSVPLNMRWFFLSLLLWLPMLSKGEDINAGDKDDILSYTVLESPFRMKKVAVSTFNTW